MLRATFLRKHARRLKAMIADEESRRCTPFKDGRLYWKRDGGPDETWPLGNPIATLPQAFTTVVCSTRTRPDTRQAQQHPGLYQKRYATRTTVGGSGVSENGAKRGTRCLLWDPPSVKGPPAYAPPFLFLNEDLEVRPDNRVA